MRQIQILAAGLLLSSGMMFAGEKGLMHCFAFTEVAGATPAEWSAFSKATDELPGKVNGLKHVWHGKLARPLTQYQMSFADDAARKKFSEAGAGTADAKVVRRQHGVCMEFADEAAFKAYGTSPGHADWLKSYEKVRVSGTTTYQIVAE